MQEEFVKDYEIFDKTDEEREVELIQNIIKVKEDLKIVNRNFEFASEEKLIDYYTYQIKALSSKLEYLIKMAKLKGIEIDMINELKIRLYSEKDEAV